MEATAWKRGWEKLARRRRARRFGSRRMMGRCWGPKKRRASARRPYLSSVQCVCSSHCLFCSHQMAWSDQSCLRSVGPRGSGRPVSPRGPGPGSEHKPRPGRAPGRTEVTAEGLHAG